MSIEPRECEVITPPPYFSIFFSCSNRTFLMVKQELWGIAENIGIELYDGYMTEECDYEGDLERIIIHSGDLDRGRALLNAVAEYYKVDVPKGMEMHLSC